ncbi:MAG: hypothetical protein ACD_64C00215G0004 [uncultured bacterium]|nr:MAG: hypothetical protein ACD_64C00215G0004 [uncultured bacterium]HLE76600.1 hypothetical protein [Candidatus Babeliales bacterium]
MYDLSGIVLKKLSAHKVAILNDRVGRIDAISIKAPHVGSLIRYRVQRERGTLHFLEYYSIIDLPFFLGRSDILFWHHVLELCYHFMPVGSYASELFELLSFLYTVEKENSWGMHAKKMYLFKLLSTIGIQTEIPQLPAVKLQQFMAMSASQMKHVVLDEQSEKILDKWIRVCVSEHPAIEQFKTMHFLVGE